MKRIATSFATLILMTGVLWGVGRWMGVEEPFLSRAWFSNATAKMQDVIDFGKDSAPDLSRAVPSKPR